LRIVDLTNLLGQGCLFGRRPAALGIEGRRLRSPLLPGKGNLPLQYLNLVYNIVQLLARSGSGYHQILAAFPFALQVLQLLLLHG
jgi:hypothetical protein